MKFVILAVVALLSFTAQAARQTVVCTDSSSDQWKLTFDVATGKAQVLSLNQQSGRWVSDYKNAKVVRGADGGPTTISAVDDKLVDWSKTDKCYVFGKLSLFFMLGRQSTLHLNPNIKSDTSQPNCSIPRLMRPPLRTLNCIAQANP